MDGTPGAAGALIRFLPAAAAELEADVERYERQREGRGQRFLSAVDTILALVERMPETFPVLRAPRVRAAKVSRFPYRVVYVLDGETIRVLAVAHGRRRAGYWRDRLEP